MPKTFDECSREEQEQRRDDWIEETGGRDEDYDAYMNGRGSSQQSEDDDD
jgi:hypothetical protein